MAISWQLLGLHVAITGSVWHLMEGTVKILKGSMFENVERFIV